VLLHLITQLLNRGSSEDILHCFSFSFLFSFWLLFFPLFFVLSISFSSCSLGCFVCSYEVATMICLRAPCNKLLKKKKKVKPEAKLWKFQWCVIWRISAKYYLTNHADVTLTSFVIISAHQSFWSEKCITKLGPSVAQDTGCTKNHMQHRRWDYRKKREKLQ